MATVPTATFTHAAEEIDAAVDAVADKASQEDLDALAEAVEGKQDALTFDNTPTANSDNPVKSKGIKTYVDTQVATKASISDVYGIGTAIESGTDLNNLTTAGVYTCPTVTVANTLTNAPITGSAFRLEVKYLNSSTRIRQECYILSDTSTYYARTYTSTGWKPWYMFAGTAVT
jgi:hypothetical protein